MYDQADRWFSLSTHEDDARAIAVFLQEDLPPFRLSAYYWPHIPSLGALGLFDYANEPSRQPGASHKWSFPMSQLTKYTDVTVSFDIDYRQTDTELSHAETMALAQLFKRLNWSEVRGCASSDAEAYVIRAAVGKLQDALARGGYTPR